MTDEHPTINLAVHEGTGDEQLTRMLLGTEEEGVPSRMERPSELDPLTLAHHVATSSRLGTGLGIVLDYVVVITERLLEWHPHLTYFLGHSEQADQIIGSNVARLMKRLPPCEPGRDQ